MSLKSNIIKFNTYNSKCNIELLDKIFCFYKNQICKIHKKIEIQG